MIIRMHKLSTIFFLNLLILFLSATVFGQRDLQKMNRLNSEMPPAMDINEDRVQANGIKRIEGKHVVLYTDIRDREDVDELVTVFDLAVDQWCEYFEISKEKTAGWQVSAFLIEDRKRFDAARLFPVDLPDFPAGYNRGHHMWVYLQPGDYYTRHLLLHEGTHSFMQWFLGGSGSPWYSEGMAEMLAVHRWHEGQLQLNYLLKDKTEAEFWGRVKIIRDDYKSNQALTLEDVFRFKNQNFRTVRYYAWSWAACQFFSQHPLSQAQFANLKTNASDVTPNFDRKFFRTIATDMDQLNRDWKLFISEMNYGTQVNQLTMSDAIDAGDDSDSFRIDATRGWQMSKFEIQKGKTYQLSASGRYQIANDGKPWPCEPGGVTLEYYRGYPLGMLMAGTLGKDKNVEGLLNPIAVGLSHTFTAERDGVLCFRINESPAEMGDNSGSLKVQVIEK